MFLLWDGKLKLLLQMNKCIENIISRRSVKKYIDKPVPAELIEEIEKGEVSFSDVKKIVKDSDGLASQSEKLKEVKEKKAKRNRNRS